MLVSVSMIGDIVNDNIIQSTILPDRPLEKSAANAR
jgi:hypothetical protein